AQMPLSAFFLVQLSLGGLSQRQVLIIGAMPGHELLCCIVLHLAVARYTRRMHAPAKTLLSLYAARSHRTGDFHARLRLHHSIVRLHTNAKYGITYGTVGGLITMGSFAKCMILYTELLMYAYKLI